MSLAPVRPHASSRSWTYLPAYAQETLPRYTSYPPANRFDASVGPADAARAIRSLSSDATLSLYVHVPFCRKLCWYCGCHTSVPTPADPVQSYLDAMQREIELVAALIPSGARVTHVHLGGGSPDILSRPQIEALFRTLRSRFHFDRFAEIAAELDPRGASDEVVEAFAAAGLNRASLGVQVLNPDVQRRINRIQPAEEVAATIRRLRAAGVESLNLDIMYGLPAQTLADVVETAAFASNADADRIAVFGYAHVPWFKKHQKAIQTDELPGGEARFRQAEAAAETLERAGYLPIGFDHFAAPGDGLVTVERKGMLRRNFQGYTDDAADALIGFGASSISSLPNLIWQNTPDTSAYRQATGEGRAPVVRGIRLTDEDRRIARLIERLLCDFEVVVPGDIWIRACPQLSTLHADGLVEFTDGRLVVTARGRPYVRNIAAAFDPGLTPATQRHSLAV